MCTRSGRARTTVTTVLAVITRPCLWDGGIFDVFSGIFYSKWLKILKFKKMQPILMKTMRTKMTKNDIVKMAHPREFSYNEVCYSNIDIFLNEEHRIF